MSTPPLRLDLAPDVPEGSRMTATPSRNIRIPDDEWEAAKAAAAERHETITTVIRRALREYIAAGK